MLLELYGKGIKVDKVMRGNDWLKKYGFVFLSCTVQICVCLGVTSSNICLFKNPLTFDM